MTAAQAAAPLTPGAWVIHCDGSAWPNPGRMGLGAVLTGPDGTVQHQISEATTFTGCNNEAELRALMQALQWLGGDRRPIVGHRGAVRQAAIGQQIQQRADYERAARELGVGDGEAGQVEGPLVP